MLQGVNFYEVFKLSHLVEINKLESNDIGAFLRIYGVIF